MTIQVVTQSGSSQALSNSIRTQYIENYLEGAMHERLYDQIAAPIGQPMSQLKRGSAVQVEFLSDMDIGTTSISEVTDVTPQALRDAVASITPTSRGEALQASELLGIQVFTDYSAKFSKRVGANMMETVDKVAQDAAVKGDFVLRAAARGSLDAGTSGHRCQEADFVEATGYLQSFRIPGFKDPKNGSMQWPAIMNPFVYHDILTDSANVIAAAQYQNISMLFNHELGSMHGFRFVVSPYAKVLHGAGAANAKSVDTVLASELTALSKTMVISNTSSIEQGSWLNIGTVDTGSTHQYNSERVKYTSMASSPTINYIGSGANGGVRFDHAAGAVVNNNDSVYTVVIGGPDSLAKVYAPEIGEFGQIVGPKKDGILDQWDTLGWKWYGGYGRLRENGLVRLEVSVSNEA